jgi:hypothetical protein
MKFKEAKSLGLSLGLKTPKEWIDNVVAHALSIFLYKNINKEIIELLLDAEKQGIIKLEMENNVITSFEIINTDLV